MVLTKKQGNNSAVNGPRHNNMTQSMTHLTAYSNYNNNLHKDTAQNAAAISSPSAE